MTFSKVFLSWEEVSLPKQLSAVLHAPTTKTTACCSDLQEQNPVTPTPMLMLQLRKHAFATFSRQSMKPVYSA